MPRAVTDTKLDSRTARRALKRRHAPYWRLVERGSHLGYRRGRHGGTWIARRRTADCRYVFASLGAADDIVETAGKRRVLEADGLGVLDFDQAQDRAKRWFCEQRSGLSVGARRRHGQAYRVEDVMRDYLAWYEMHRKPSGLEYTRNTSETHIVSALGPRAVDEISTTEIRAWHERMATSPPRRRQANRQNGGDTAVMDVPAPTAEDAVAARPTGEALRARKATANRVLSVLKAALNRTYNDGNMPDNVNPEAWRRVKPFAGVTRARVRYLSSDECMRLVNACEDDFRPLVQAALLTGARYGEVIAMTCGDYEPDSATVLMRQTKSGKPRHAVLSEEGVALFERLTAGRKADALMFAKANGMAWRRWHQRRPLLAACKAASIEPPASFHVLRHTHASQLAMRGVPLQVIAYQLGHADTRICEMHYAHLGPSYVADVLRANMPTFGIVEAAKVSRLRQKRR